MFDGGRMRCCQHKEAAQAVSGGCSTAAHSRDSTAAERQSVAGPPVAGATAHVPKYHSQQWACAWLWLANPAPPPAHHLPPLRTVRFPRRQSATAAPPSQQAARPQRTQRWTPGSLPSVKCKITSSWVLSGVHCRGPRHDCRCRKPLRSELAPHPPGYGHRRDCGSLLHLRPPPARMRAAVRGGLEQHHCLRLREAPAPHPWACQMRLDQL